MPLQILPLTDVFKIYMLSRGTKYRKKDIKKDNLTIVFISFNEHIVSVQSFLDRVY